MLDNTGDYVTIGHVGSGTARCYTKKGRTKQLTTRLGISDKTAGSGGRNQRYIAGVVTGGCAGGGGGGGGSNGENASSRHHQFGV